MEYPEHISSAIATWGRLSARICVLDPGAVEFAASGSISAVGVHQAVFSRGFQSLRRLWMSWR